MTGSEAGMQTDLARLSDPEFMAEAERLRDELEHQGDRVNLADLRQRYGDLAAEFERRVSAVRGA